MVDNQPLTINGLMVDKSLMASSRFCIKGILEIFYPQKFILIRSSSLQGVAKKHIDYVKVL